jgi:four helix bundle protein
MTIRGYQALRVWQLSMDLVADSYRISASFPKQEAYGLTSQMRRAAVSIPANIAEGHGRRHMGECLHHLSIANGSLRELETHVQIASRLQYLTDADLSAMLNNAAEVARMLHGLATALRRRRSPGS